MVRALSFLLLLVGLAGCADDPPGPLAAGCTLERKADLQLTIVRNFMLAPVSIDGRRVLLVVDTGAEASTLTPEAAAALHLPRDASHGSVLIGISGPIRTPNVRVAKFDIDTIQRTDQSLGLGRMPAFPGLHPPVSGLLGTDVLSGYEVDLDVPNGRMSLYAAHGCAGGYRPWPGALAVPLIQTRSGLLFVEALVDGRTVTALLDTGARTSLISRRTAATLGVTDATLAGDPERKGIGIGMGGIEFRQHRFTDIGLPGAMVYGMAADVADLRLPGVEMLLGADFLGPRRIWLSYATSTLYLR